MATIFSTQDTRLAAGARILLPAVWLGLIIVGLIAALILAVRRWVSVHPVPSVATSGS